MHERINEEAVETFWQWFVKNDSLIKNCIEQNDIANRQYVIDNLNNFILGFGMFTWDIGQDDSGNWFFTISPNGDEELFIISNEIMSEAPVHLDWIYHPAKPQKPWSPTIRFHNDSLDETYLEIINWKYLAFECEDERIEIVFEAKNIQNFDEITIQNLLESFVINELGESNRIQRISTITLAEDLKKEFDDEGESIQNFRHHLT